ncbi:putative disease resistance protein RGA3 [Pistacia vera]|uniref:putative disease resistance protein RGA3 n=1 Tax=Pistacia vera TaxID=55513 RepID=UPI001263D88F|nr:putative disease resistance protein RGA3 [Pistacia vera]
MADAFVHILLENLNSLIRKEVGLLWGIDKDMKKLSSLLSTIQAVLEDAEEKQVKNKALQNWLQKLKEAAYKVDDILDDCAAEVSRLESEDQNSRFINKVNTSFLNKLRPDNILFCRKIGIRMREIRERLDEIAEERTKFHLNEVVLQRGAEVGEERQTGSIITQSHVYGRDEDKEIIVENLVNHVACCDDISVYPIVGIGGLGKTTLAQVVYNDERVSMHFELRIWVCISEDFSVKKIIKAIIGSATGTACEDLELDPLQRRLQDILNRKRYLLVLDDVWSEDEEKWDRLKCVLACGSKGASIIVTTRSRKVASIMGTLPMHHLSGLSEDECWLLFKERAFGQEKEERPNLVAVGKEIVKKCSGVPLAVKSLGSLMRYKSEENEWLCIKESELWNLPQDKNSILPALRLSYSHLPSKIKRCFAFCAVFPKDSEIKRQKLIHLWIASGFIQCSQNFEPEDIGIEICNELYWRSFFQDAKKDEFENNLLFKMHDLVHDLAQFIVKDEFAVMEAKDSNNISKSTLHVRIDVNSFQSSYKGSEALYGVETLRTLIMAPASGFSCDISTLISLRVLRMPTIGMSVSSSIHHLKHLRYVDLSHGGIKLLPKSLCNLLNLQTLNLKNCFALRKLPNRMRCLKNLRHLHLNGCTKLSQMPPHIGQITCLKTLTLFIVGERRGCHLAELKYLNLGEELRVTHLNRVGNLMDTQEANSVEKPNLRRLELSWELNSESESREKVEKIFEALQPHSNLEILKIEGYKGAKFPVWMDYQILSNVVSITLSDCENCRQLPPLWQLPRLRCLTIINLINLEYINTSFQGERKFPYLEELHIDGLPRLQMLSRQDGSELFPCLTKLKIYDCPELTTLPCLPSAKSLVIHSCNGELLKSISHSRSLTYLYLHTLCHLFQQITCYILTFMDH